MSSLDIAESPTSHQVSNNNNSKVFQLLKNPINLLYKFYEEMSAGEPPSVQNSADPSLVRPPSPPQMRLHSKAEDCGSSLLAGTASVMLRRGGGEVDAQPELMDMPVGVVLQIASYLDVRSLCMLQRTSKHFYALTNDELLWRRKLEEDSRQWTVVGHLSHPRVYQDASSDLTAQEIYESCFVNRTTVTQQQSFAFPVAQKLRSFMRRLQGHVPRLLMFGSGLETVPLVKRMILDTNSPYKPTGLIPGKDGAGSGISVKHKNSSVNIVTLYTATKAERVAASQHQGGRINKLISAATDNTTENDAPKLTAAVQEQCQMADGFILAVDASNMNEEVLESDMTTLRAMLLSSTQRIPVLVLSCVFIRNEATNDDTTVPSLDVADKLKLLDISNPWQVRTLNVQTFEGLEDAFDWILTTASNS